MRSELGFAISLSNLSPPIHILCVGAVYASTVVGSLTSSESFCLSALCFLVQPRALSFSLSRGVLNLGLQAREGERREFTCASKKTEAGGRLFKDYLT